VVLWQSNKYLGDHLPFVKFSLDLLSWLLGDKDNYDFEEIRWDEDCEDWFCYNNSKNKANRACLTKLLSSQTMATALVQDYQARLDEMSFEGKKTEPPTYRGGRHYSLCHFHIHKRGDVCTSVSNITL